MKFNDHFNLVGQHAFLSASGYHWINYDEEKLDSVFRNSHAAKRGSELHAFAHDAIRLNVKMPTSKKTINMYINDAIGYRMTPEQVLYYSQNCFGTPDAISFNRNLLRIHDLKTGVTAASMSQLEVYAALFCLEYSKRPSDINIELRIYQSDEVFIEEPDPERILYIMGKIISSDKIIEQIKLEG